MTVVNIGARRPRDWTASQVFREKTPYELADHACTGPHGPSTSPAHSQHQPGDAGAFVAELAAAKRPRARSEPRRSAGGGARSDRRRRRRSPTGCARTGTSCSSSEAGAGQPARIELRRRRRDSVRTLSAAEASASHRPRGQRLGLGHVDVDHRPHVNSAASAPLSVSGLASGLDTSSIISALMSAEREPVTHLTSEQVEADSASRCSCRACRASLQQLARRCPNSTCRRCSKARRRSPPANPRGRAPPPPAAPGSAATRSKSRSSPTPRSAPSRSPARAPNRRSRSTGREYSVAGLGRRARNWPTRSTPTATAHDLRRGARSGAIVLSSRATGNTGARIHQGHDPGGALAEQAGAAKEGANAEFTVDGVAGTSQREHRHQADRRGHADAQRAHEHRAGDDRRAAARARTRPPSKPRCRRS